MRNCLFTVDNFEEQTTEGGCISNLLQEHGVEKIQEISFQLGTLRGAPEDARTVTFWLPEPVMVRSMYELVSGSGYPQDFGPVPGHVF